MLRLTFTILRRRKVGPPRRLRSRVLLGHHSLVDGDPREGLAEHRQRAAVHAAASARRPNSRRRTHLSALWQRGRAAGCVHRVVPRHVGRAHGDPRAEKPPVLPRGAVPPRVQVAAEQAVAAHAAGMQRGQHAHRLRVQAVAPFRGWLHGRHRLEGREQLGIANYSVSQTSLEQIFNNFARMQEEEQLDEKSDAAVAIAPHTTAVAVVANETS